MIDVDKLVVSIMEFAPVSNEIKYLLSEALKKQGIIYKDGQLQRLDGSCESSKDENIPYSTELTEFEEKLGSIIFNTWDIMKDCEECKGDVDYIKEKADELLGIASRNSKAKEEGYSKPEVDIDMMVAEYSASLVVPNSELDNIIQSRMCLSYRKGIIDTLNKLNIKKE